MKKERTSMKQDKKIPRLCRKLWLKNTETNHKDNCMDFELSKKFNVFKCGHKFHKRCIIEFIDEKDEESKN